MPTDSVSPGKQVVPSGTPEAGPTASTASSPIVLGQEETKDAQIREVTVGDHQLPGAITFPTGETKAAVLLLAGSGPHDLNGTVGSSENKFLKDIADGLASHGVASLRYSKVTKHAPDSLDRKQFTLDDEYFDDAAYAVSLLQEQPELSNVKLFVAGHSQGGMVMPELLKRNSQLVGGISLAGTPRSLFDVIKEQNLQAIDANQNLDDAQRDAQRKLAEETAELAKKIDDPSDEVPLALGQSMSSAYIASLNAFDAETTAKQLGVPMLFLHGEADRQVFHGVDFKAWQDALDGKSNVTFKDYPNLNHFFGESTGMTALDDINSAERVNAQVITDMAGWLHENS